MAKKRKLSMSCTLHLHEDANPSVLELSNYVNEALLSYSGCYDPDCDLFHAVAAVRNIKIRGEKTEMQPDMKFINDLEQQLAAFIETLDPNSDLCHWLINTHTRLIKAQSMGGQRSE